MFRSLSWGKSDSPLSGTPRNSPRCSHAGTPSLSSIFLNDNERNRRRPSAMTKGPAAIGVLMVALLLTGMYLLFLNLALLTERTAQVEKLSASLQVQSLDFARIESKLTKCTQDFAALSQEHPKVDLQAKKQLQQAKEQLQSALQNLKVEMNSFEADDVAYWNIAQELHEPHCKAVHGKQELQNANGQLQSILQAKIKHAHTLESQVQSFELQLNHLVAALHKLEGSSPLSKH